MNSLDALRERIPAGLLRFNSPSVARLLERGDRQFAICAPTVFLALVLGGGTRGGFLSDAILELAAIPCLLWSLNQLFDPSRDVTLSQHRWVLILCVAIVLVPLIQLIPLPPWLWTRLPNRKWMTTVYQLLGTGMPWRPLSVAPRLTWLSLLSLIVPFAVFVATIQLGYRQRRLLSLMILGFGVLSCFVGLSQFAHGEGSALYFYLVTNFGNPVGFFANKNHFAALLYVSLAFAFAWIIDAVFRVGSWKDRASFETPTAVALAASLLVVMVLLMTEVFARSRAASGLTIVVLAGAFAMAFMDRRNTFDRSPAKLLRIAMVVGMVVLVQFTLYRILQRFADPLQDARIQFTRNTLAAAWAYFPFGSGFGTFVPVYAMFEKPADILPHTYANHAHDDILELLLESGVFGLALLISFLVWFGMRAKTIWSRGVAIGQDIDRALARAATIAIVLLIAHSLVDYPLRTAALMAMLGFCCGLLIEPLHAEATTTARAPIARRDAVRPRSHSAVSVRPAPASVPSAVANRGLKGLSPAPPHQPGGRWGDDIEWPEQWRKPGDNGPDNAGGGRP